MIFSLTFEGGMLNCLVFFYINPANHASVVHSGYSHETNNLGERYRLIEPLVCLLSEFSQVLYTLHFQAVVHL